ncbi:hypothetical protein [Roseomonas indoligenes]|uniref:Uncharacterized protein n=1 Tax=Roseomonas indoligenes TaxID=2820811 RepID=A0A940S5B6_9PROT|nr:hypothetical protein [Pararoseomonas indoligenes]MBP0492775.1 hypothetical protein [Pararoseomonas indoligenes]
MASWPGEGKPWFFADDVSALAGADDVRAVLNDPTIPGLSRRENFAEFGKTDLLSSHGVVAVLGRVALRGGLFLAHIIECALQGDALGWDPKDRWRATEALSVPPLDHPLSRAAQAAQARALDMTLRVAALQAENAALRAQIPSRVDAAHRA